MLGTDCKFLTYTHPCHTCHFYFILKTQYSWVLVRGHPTTIKAIFGSYSSLINDFVLTRDYLFWGTKHMYQVERQTFSRKLIHSNIVHALLSRYCTYLELTGTRNSHRCIYTCTQTQKRRGREDGLSIVHKCASIYTIAST